MYKCKPKRKGVTPMHNHREAEAERLTGGLR